MVYERVLGDLPDDLLEAAVLRCLAECTFFPVVAEIRRRAVDLAMEGRRLPSSYEAWGEVRRRVSLAGTERQRWSNPLIGQALGYLGGLDAYGQSETSDEASWRARFLECYERLVQRQREDASVLPQIRALTERLRLEAS